MKKGWLRHLDFIIVDLFAIELSLLFTFFAARLFSWHVAADADRLCLLIPFLHLSACLILEAYDGILQRGYLKEFLALIRLEFWIFFLQIFFFYFLNLFSEIPRRLLITYFAFCIPLSYVFRFFHKFFLSRLYRSVKHTRQIVVATTKREAESMIHAITGSSIRNYQFFGLAVLDESMIGETIGNITVSADRSTLTDYIRQHIVDEVFLSVPGRTKETLAVAGELLEMGIIVHISVEDTYQSLPNRRIGDVFGYRVLTATISPISFRQAVVKRIMDIAGGLVGCILTALIAIIIGPLIFLHSPGPIFFKQIRVGKQGRKFKLYKFRSMYMDAEERKKDLMEQNRIPGGLMFKLDHDPRVIRGIGSFIRKTSLDEFPQFFNVLKGDMSLVGTRPPTVDEYERYSPHHKRRLSIKPGITGLWQVSGRSSITDFEEVIRLDTQYIENWSFEQDIKLILRTIVRMFDHFGAS